MKFRSDVTFSTWLGNLDFSQYQSDIRNSKFSCLKNFSEMDAISLFSRQGVLYELKIKFKSNDDFPL